MITYLPLTMTKSENVPEIKHEFHEGSIFFPMPEGKALQFKLQGKSLPPKAKEEITIELKAKKP